MTDERWFEDMDPYDRELDDPVAELDQDILHMLLESYGSNIDAPTRSCALSDALNGTELPEVLARRIEAKLEEDDRIDSATATLTNEGNNVTGIKLDVVANGEALGLSYTYDPVTGIKRAA